MGLAPILVEKSFEIIKQVNDEGVAVLVVEQNANVSLSIADRGYVLSTGRVVLEGKAADLIENDDLRKAYLGPMSSCHHRSRRCRDRFPIFERLVYVNSCSQGALSDAVRGAYDAYLTDWDEQGRALGLLGRARRGGARGVRRPRRRRAGRGRGHDLALGGRQRARERASTTGERPRVVVTDFEFPTIGQIWHAQELRGAEVVHVRPDGGEIPLERFDEAIDERTALVAITAVCYRNGARLPVEEIVEHRPRPRRARPARRLPGDRHVPDRRLARSASTSSAAGVLKYLLASAGLGFLWCRSEPDGGAPPDPDRLVRRPEHLRDGRPRLLAVADRPAVRVGHAADPGDLRGHRRHRADPGDRDRRDPRARHRAERAPDRRRRRARRSRRDAARPQNGAARSSASARPTRPRSSRALGGRTGSSPPSATATCASPPTPTTSKTTSTRSLAALARHRELLGAPDESLRRMSRLALEPRVHAPA